MEERGAAHWEAEFEGKDWEYLESCTPPVDTTPGERHAWHGAWQRARAAFKRAREEHEREALMVDSASRLARISAMMAQKSVLPPEEAEKPRLAPQQPLSPPAGDAAALIEHQLATCAALIGSIAEHTNRTMNLDSMVYFADRVASLMKASAEAAKVVARLRSEGPEETRHRIVVERIAPQGEGEGVLRT